MSNTGISRRDLIKWGTFVGAALGLPHWKVLECLDHTLGKAYGAVVAEPQTAATVIGYAPNGGLAHYTQFWGTSPQVAARGATHYMIAKSSEGTVTRTSVALLDADGRQEEIARMLSGAEITAEARAQADRLLEGV